MVICLDHGVNLRMAQLVPLPLAISCSSKSRLVLPSWCWLSRVVLDRVQEGRKTVVCVCVCVVRHVLVIRAVPNSGCVVFGRIRIIDATIRPNTNRIRIVEV